jgi:hypothetical protein
MKRYHILIFGLMALLSACNTNDEVLHPQYDEALEIKGIQVGITGAEAALTRAATVDPLKVSLGRTKFVANDSIVFTTIMRTDTPLDSFTYSNIHYVYNGSSWDRASNGTTKDPEKIYWTDGHNTHTFIGYCVPSGYHWEVKNTSGIDTYAGELGYGKTPITFDSKDAIEKEDPLVLYSDSTKADAGGLTTTVYFNHALSGVRVVVNIKDFAASATSLDTLVTVSDFKLLKQPCKYTWGAHGMTDVTALDFGDGQTTKDITLWCPQPKGEGKAQSKTFTFYGLTTPQDATFHGVTANSDEYLQFQFTVKYPDADNTTTLTKTYTGKFSKLVNFQSGKCTTLNISLNHQNEQMFTKVTYDDWDFVATPDLGELRKKSTFMDIDSQVTIHSDANATIDDATWLYKDENKVVKDIYGNDGSAASPYLIKSASQLLSFAKEVKNNNTFGNKYVRLDADITMQKSSDKTSVEDTTSNVSAVSWIGIGDADHPFQGTFLGGDRYINRLSGSPLFVNLGDSACVEQLYITTIGIVTGAALAGTNAGEIGGCKVIDDVTLSGEGGGALVGTNASTGVIHACYYTGDGDLVGNQKATDHGTIVGCYQAGQISSFTNSTLSSFVADLNSQLTTWYGANSGKFKSKFQFTYTIGNYPTVQVAP